MQTKNIQIKAKATPHNAKQVAAAKELDTQEQINGQVARINGYAYALVNMDVIEEKTANTEVMYAACMAAAARQEELEGLRRKWQ